MKDRRPQGKVMVFPETDTPRPKVNYPGSEKVKLPEDLVNVFKSGKTVAVLATFSEKGLPHTTPIQCLYPKGLESILITIHKDHTGYHNMVWQKKVMLCFMDENNVAYSVLAKILW